ncbi:MAG: 6-carboxytetrahydropterin synthase [Dehalococcoidia bacterium]|nr:6-carboxytetrahydropterin synthase [Dehalococcoidia bacterium]
MSGHYRVTKTFDFCYGHRLLRYEGKCRHLHGHNGRVEVDVSAGGLDALGMVVDFGDISATLKQWVDANLDHRMLLCRDDPVARMLGEMGEPLYLMDDNPTAENIARLIFQEGRSAGLNVAEVRLWETPTGCASYAES